MWHRWKAAAICICDDRRHTLDSPLSNRQRVRTSWWITQSPARFRWLTPPGPLCLAVIWGLLPCDPTVLRQLNARRSCCPPAPCSNERLLRSVILSSDSDGASPQQGGAVKPETVGILQLSLTSAHFGALMMLGGLTPTGTLLHEQAASEQVQGPREWVGSHVWLTHLGADNHQRVPSSSELHPYGGALHPYAHLGSGSLRESVRSID